MAKKPSASERLETLVNETWAVVKKAKKHRKSLSGDNYYANKLAENRSAAICLYNEMSVYNVADLAALAKMIESVFSADSEFEDRRDAITQLLHEIRTVWKVQSAGDTANQADTIFPMNLLARTRRGYLSTIGAQMNGAYGQNWCDACAVMMRRLLEVSIIEAFEARGIAGSITGKDGKYVMLTELISLAIKETSWHLEQATKKALPGLRDLGHQSAHGRRFTAQKSDIDKVRHDVRTTVEEFLQLAGLL